ncbi:MAG: DNA repair ATPase [Phycisphaeraceae bacterium]|nr:DNA repair ATPase [Phycisphaeraceae bacterium]
MAEQTPAPEAAAEPEEREMDQGAYQVLRERLVQAGRDLRARLDKLNEARKKVFGGVETRLIGTDRITTPHNCVPRDMAAFGERFLFGYNVRFGLKQEIDVGDVFTCSRFDGEQFHEEPIKPIATDRFVKEFKDLYRFYRNATFSKFFLNAPYLYMKFQVGRDREDFKAFKWAIEGDQLVYVDNRSDHEIRYPAAHDLDWKRVTRDMLRPGKFPHYSIEDRVFVETISGELTIKIEDSTEHGRGIYAEPVDDPDQGPDDADISYAVHGHLILLRIKPFKENQFRYFIFNEKLHEVVRQDALAGSCLMLPDDHGLIFSKGFYLASGRHQTFSNVPDGMIHERRISSPNGEDFLYVFYHRDQGTYALLPYNLIEQRIDTPIICSGFSLFEDGKLVYFKSHEEPQRHHALQIWQTPFIGPNQRVEGDASSRLYKIGNRDIVRGMAECAQLLQLIERESLYSDLYLDIVKTSSDLLEGYHWLREDECFNLDQVIGRIRETGQSAVAEYEKVVRLRRAADQAIGEEEDRTRAMIARNAARMYNHIDAFVTALAELREARGRIIGLKEVRYADARRVEAMEADVTEQTETLSQRCVAFLLKEDSLQPYRDRVGEFPARIEAVRTAVDARELGTEIEAAASELEMLIEIVGNLKIEDSTQRTTIIDAISAIFGNLNASRQALRNRAGELGRVEGEAEFNSQLRLLSQSTANYLDLCDEPLKVDTFLTRMLVQIEELEGRFAEFDDFVVRLAQTRDDVVSAFEQRKLQLVERRNRRAIALGQAADRILSGIKVRVEAMDSIAAINGYFAGDLMIDKLRDIVKELIGLEDTVRADDIQGRLRSLREDAVRRLKDRLDLQAEGPNSIRFGRHVFSVNTQPIELTMVQRDGKMQLHINGTRFFEPVDDVDLNEARQAWNQELISENEAVYRAEYLAFVMLPDLLAMPEMERRELLDPGGDRLLEHVRRFMGPRYGEGYTKGVHDADAALIVRELVDLSESIGLLRYSSAARALAGMFWRAAQDSPAKRFIASQLEGYAEVVRAFPESRRQEQYIHKVARLIGEFAEQNSVFSADHAQQAAEYLFLELTGEEPGFITSPEADELINAFEDHLKANHLQLRFNQSLDAADQGPMARFLLARDWLAAFVRDSDRDQARAGLCLDEAAFKLYDRTGDHGRLLPVQARRTVEGLRGGHGRIKQGRMELDYLEFVDRLGRFAREDVPRFERFTAAKRRIVERTRDQMRVDEFTPRVLTTFVRNRLIDRVFLPLIGANMAKQIGTAGADARTDRNGLLMVISPPGYGKTTLMEYLASRLGIVFMKINGPALGRDVTSLDPEEAPNAGAREEIIKLNLAFEMGDNVMIYVDDIQHTHPEFLQKFISLCDAQRKIEGVYKGRARTYDLRGRKVAVVMAGNPYTESGEKFRVPDMLANRADTYNLGDIIGDHGEAFRTSYIENALTSNPTLRDLATRSQGDVYNIIRIAETGTREGIDFEANFTTDQIEEMVNVMKKLLQVRDIILRVNQQYIRSAGMDDRYRREPVFLLQGSYRNMNRIAERILPVMNDDELKTLVLSTYEQDAQMLTTGAEANLLKFKEMMGWMSETEKERWDEICRAFVRQNEVAAMGGDQTAAVVAQLSRFNEGLGQIGSAIERAKGENGKPLVTKFDDQAIEAASQLSSRLDALAAAAQRWIEERAERPEPAEPPPATPAAADPPTPEEVTGQPSPYQIRITNRVPEAFLVIIRQQFDLMKAWLEPLSRITADQEGRIKQVIDSLESLADKYQGIIRRLEESEE